MEKSKNVNITKKLQNLVKRRKTQVVVYEQGSLKYTSHSSSGSRSLEGYSDYE